MRLLVFAHLLAPSAAARTRAEVHQSSKRAPPFHPLVVFKRGRTGSTWFADLLTNEPAVAFFAHDQLVDTAHVVFKTLHLPGNRTSNFEEYEH